MAKSRSKPLLDAVAGALTVGLLGAIKHTDRKRMANFAGALMRKIGPLFKEHRLGRDNCARRFRKNPTPRSKKSSAASGTISGRIAIEFAHLDEFCVEGFGTPTRRCHHLSARIQRALRLDHEERPGDDRLCRPSRQLGIARASAPN